MTIVVRGIAVLLISTVLMPLISFLAIKHFHYTSKQKDFRLTQACGLLAIVGFTAIGMAPTPIVLIVGLATLSFGSAIAVTSRTLATSFVPEDQIGTLYSIIQITMGVGMMSAGPLLAYAYRLGLALGKKWSGLPFLLGATLLAISLAIFSFIRLEPSRNGSSLAGEEEAAGEE